LNKTWILIGLFLASTLVHAQDKPKFRTDADGPVKGDEKRRNPREKQPSDKPDWYPLVDGQFPPEGSAHAVSGELIAVDHLERRFQIRVDRNDSQDRALQDLPLPATMLPYGAIWQHGAPAALQDIPLGTHLHGLFYLAPAGEKAPLLDTAHGRKTPEYEFRRCFRLEDDFSFHTRRKQLWKIDSVNLEKQKLSATLQENGNPVGQAKLFDLQTSTRVMLGNGFVDVKALQPGQTVLFNLTWATLFGPGRITDLWIDETARALVTGQQLERHRNHIRERGLPGWVAAVDDAKSTVTITFFSSVDPTLFEELKGINEEPQGWPFSGAEDDPKAPKGGIAVARDSLLTYDPLNDRKGGNILKIGTVPVEPGCSGVQITVKCSMMLEGYRPKRIVRFFPARWKVDALPKEEEFNGRE
jgi:hypothetical protein